VVDESSKIGNLDEILERDNILIRPALANVSRFFIVSSIVSPNFDPFFVDKQLCVCEFSEITPVLIINKTDLADCGEYSNLYKKIGYDVIDAKIGGNSLGANVIVKGINIFAGFSGVGKSTLLSGILGQKLETGDLSKITRGKHTTRHSELFKIAPDTYLADTPGFSSFEINWKIPDLAACFREFEAFTSCKFADCSHTKEKGCGVLEAVAAGEIAKSRHESYVKIYKTIKNIKDWD
jgi:ribosome biogenesis GTPase